MQTMHNMSLYLSPCRVSVGKTNPSNAVRSCKCVYSWELLGCLAADEGATNRYATQSLGLQTYEACPRSVVRHAGV